MIKRILVLMLCLVSTGLMPMHSQLAQEAARRNREVAQRGQPVAPKPLEMKRTKSRTVYLQAPYEPTCCNEAQSCCLWCTCGAISALLDMFKSNNDDRYKVD